MPAIPPEVPMHLGAVALLVSDYDEAIAYFTGFSVSG
jgi:hypothetical protein